MSDPISVARLRARYFAKRTTVGGDDLDYNVATSDDMFLSANTASANYDPDRGYDDGGRYNIRIKPETNPIWVRFNSAENDPIFIDGDEIYEEFNIVVHNIYVTPADATTAQVDRIVYTNELGTCAVTTFTTADFAGSTSGDYGVFYDTNGAAWAFALDKTGSAPAPTGAAWTAIAAGKKTNVDISSATTATDIANLVRTALNALTGFAALFTTSGTATLVITRDIMGPVTAAAVHNADDSGAGSITVANTTTGVVSNHNNTYVKLFARNATSFAETVYGLWYNVNSEGVQPVDSDVDTWLPVAFAAAATAATIGAAAELVVDGVTGVFTSEDSTPGTLNITHSVSGVRRPAEDVSSPDTVSTPTAGAGQDTVVNILVR